MYKVALVFSIVMWAFVIAIILSTPTDVRRTVRMLRDTRGKTAPPIRAYSHARSELDEHSREHVRSPRATGSALDRTADLDARVVELLACSRSDEFVIVCDGDRPIVRGVAERVGAVTDVERHQLGSHGAALPTSVGFAHSSNGSSNTPGSSRNADLVTYASAHRLTA